MRLSEQLLTLDELSSRGRIAWKKMMEAIEEHAIPSKINFWNMQWCYYNTLARDGEYIKELDAEKPLNLNKLVRIDKVVEL